MTAPQQPQGADEPSAARRARRTALLLAALALLPYLNALDKGFVYDDDGLVRSHEAVQSPFDLGRVLAANYWGDRDDTRLWRPIATLSFAIGDAIADDSAPFAHAVNVAAHALATMLAYLAALALLGARAPSHASLDVRDHRVAFAAAALFAVHPLHTEAVTWISGRSEVFAAIGSFAAIAAAHARGRGAPLACAVASAFAIGSKESAATIAPFLALLLALRPRGARPSASAVAASAAAVVLVLGARALVLDGIAPPIVGPDENAMVGTSFAARLPTVLDAFGRALALVAWPHPLAIDYGPPTLGLLDAMSGFAWLGALAALACLALALARPRSSATAIALFGLSSYAVASNAFVVIGTNFAERLFYTPSFGVLALATLAADRIAEGTPARRRFARALLALAVIALATRTVVRNRDYRDDLTLAEATLAVHPASPKMQYNLARELVKRERHAEAVAAAERALASGSEPTWAPIVLANALVGAGREDDALAVLRSELDRDARKLVVRQRLLELLEQRGELAQADALAEDALATLPAASAAANDWRARAALAAQRRGDLALAVERWQTAIAGDAARSHWHTQLGLAHFGLGSMRDAERELERALELDRDDATALNALAWIATDAQDGAARERAVALARRAVELAPTADHRDTLARALAAVGECRAALAEAALASASGGPEHEARREELAARCGDGRADAPSADDLPD